MMHRIFGTKEDVQYVNRVGAYFIPFKGNCIGVIKTPKGYFLLGGGLENDETDMECLTRECLEEAGYTILIRNRICTAESYVRHDTIGYLHMVQTYYSGELLEKVQAPIESNHELLWLKYEELKGKMYSEMQEWALQQVWDKRKNSNDKIIVTKDLILRNPKFEDWESMYRNVWSQAETAKYMLWRVTLSEEEAKERMIKSILYQEKHPDHFFVYEKTSGEGIGFAGMMEIKSNVYEDTGIALGPKYTGKGYGKQILNALFDIAREYGAKEFVCSCRSDNVASAKLQMSCGMTYDYSEDRTDPRDRTEYQLDFYRIKF